MRQNYGLMNKLKAILKGGKGLFASFFLHMISSIPERGLENNAYRLSFLRPLLFFFLTEPARPATAFSIVPTDWEPRTGYAYDF